MMDRAEDAECLVSVVHANREPGDLKPRACTSHESAFIVVCVVPHARKKGIEEAVLPDEFQHLVEIMKMS
jgi:hypothetical protein